MKCTRVNYHGIEYNRKKLYDIEFYAYRTQYKQGRTVVWLCDETGQRIGCCYIEEVTYTNETKEIDIKSNA